MCGKDDKICCKICTVDAGIRSMKILMSLLPMPGKHRLSAEEAFSKICYLSLVCSVELLVMYYFLFSPVDSIWSVMFVWRMRGNSIKTVLCYTTATYLFSVMHNPIVHTGPQTGLCTLRWAWLDHCWLDHFPCKTPNAEMTQIMFKGTFKTDFSHILWNVPQVRLI